MEKNRLIEEINALKKKNKAIIVAHNYQVNEIQEIADVVGDSFALSKYCASSDADVVVFCGVRFMAESAKILSPGKTVLLPEIDAGCPMADMITAEELREEKKRHPGAAVVCYINSSTEVKAESDICCTSSNAVNVVKAVDQQEVLFVPDKNLGNYISKMVPEKRLILWNGFCITHHRINRDEVEKIKTLHPEALILVHPECRPEILELADYVGSTKQIMDYAKASGHSKFIIGTEMGVLYKLRKDSPNKLFYMMSQGLVCPNMKKTSLNSVYEALRDFKYKIELDEDIRIRAKKALDRMLEIN
ncbi:MAG: quinolinate synthase NadA [Clostridiales bacterium]|jgi:quinolinate synthase|nr:quinolinate synthase NadA [Eubacteriales bacterium]MDH7567769.1 quinolinate synthase NadA [Clostridiales bacterium]